MKLTNILRFLTIAMLTCCTEPKETIQVVPDTTLFREGDLVLRFGRGAESHLVGMMDSGIYSHIGILHYDSLQGWMVIHSVPGEAPEGEEDVTKSEPIDSFFMSERATRGGLARVRCDSLTATQAARYALSKATLKVPFDHGYTLTDTTSLYCTELVWHAYLAQGLDITNGKHITPTATTHILPSDILNNHNILFHKPMKTNSIAY